MQQRVDNMASVRSLVASFEDATIPHDSWDHQAHLTVAAWYNLTQGPDEALASMRAGVQRINQAHGVETTDTEGYHETLTRAWIGIVASKLMEHENANAADRVAATVEELSDKRVVLQHYSRDLIMSRDARYGWVEPDLHPIRFPNLAVATRNVLFDVDGVLVHGYHARPELRVCWDEHLERDFGISRQDFKERFIFGVFVNEVIIGKRDLKSALAEHLPKLGYDGDVDKFIQYWMKNDANINTDLLPHVEALQASGKHRLFIATNQEHNRAQYLMSQAGFDRFFEDIFYSGRLGILKPEPLYFKRIEEQLPDSPWPPLLYDDKPEVINGARNFGWEAIEFIDTANIRDHRAIAEALTS